MTEQEIINRLRGALYHTEGPEAGDVPRERADAVAVRALIYDLDADVRAEEEAPQQAEDVKAAGTRRPVTGTAPRPVNSFDVARGRVVEVIRDLPDDGTTDATRDQLLALMDDLADAHAHKDDDRPAADVKPDPRQPGPEPAPPPAPRTVIIILPPGVRALIEAEAT